jgi:hypothetical protein
MHTLWIVLTLGLWHSHPLDRLEQLTREVAVWESGYIAPEGSEREPELRRLQALVEGSLSMTVLEMPGSFPSAGRAYPADRVIQVNGGLSKNAQLQVVAHEAAHLLQPAGLDPIESEVFAEAVASLVTRDDPHVYARYLARYKSQLQVLHIYRREILRAAEVLSGHRQL